MDAKSLIETSVGLLGGAYTAIESLRKLPPGKYTVRKTLGENPSEALGFVTVATKGMFAKRYKTRFSNFNPAGGPDWDGELELKFDMMCEGVFRYRHNHACGTHKLFLLESGIIKVYIRDEERPDDLETLYWVKMEHKA